jgi:hypothetical protein
VIGLRRMAVDDTLETLSMISAVRIGQAEEKSYKKAVKRLGRGL